MADELLSGKPVTMRLEKLVKDVNLTKVGEDLAEKAFTAVAFGAGKRLLLAAWRKPQKRRPSTPAKAADIVKEAEERFGPVRILDVQRSGDSQSAMVLLVDGRQFKVIGTSNGSFWEAHEVAVEGDA